MYNTVDITEHKAAVSMISPASIYYRQVYGTDSQYEVVVVSRGVVFLQGRLALGLGVSCVVQPYHTHCSRVVRNFHDTPTPTATAYKYYFSVCTVVVERYSYHYNMFPPFFLFRVHLSVV